MKCSSSYLYQSAVEKDQVHGMTPNHKSIFSRLILKNIFIQESAKCVGSLAQLQRELRSLHTPSGHCHVRCVGCPPCQAPDIHWCTGGWLFVSSCLHFFLWIDTHGVHMFCNTIPVTWFKLIETAFFFLPGMNELVWERPEWEITGVRSRWEEVLERNPALITRPVHFRRWQQRRPMQD